MNSYLTQYRQTTIDVQFNRNEFTTTDNQIIRVITDKKFHNKKSFKLFDNIFNDRFDKLIICLSVSDDKTATKSNYKLIELSKQDLAELIIGKYYTRLCKKWYHLNHYYIMTTTYLDKVGFYI